MEHRKRLASGLAASAVFAAVLAFTATRDVQAGVQKLKAKDAFSSPEWVDGLEQAEDAEQLLVVAGIGETTA